MGIYVKLGERANTFSDPSSGFNITGDEVKKMSDSERKSGRTVRALRFGHIVKATSEEFKQFEASKKAVPREESVEVLKAQLLEANRKNALLLEEKAKREKEEEEEEEPFSPFEGKTDEELVAYYEDNYDISKKDLSAFKRLSTEEKVKELEALEAQEE